MHSWTILQWLAVACVPYPYMWHAAGWAVTLVLASEPESARGHGRLPMFKVVSTTVTQQQPGLNGCCLPGSAAAPGVEGGAAVARIAGGPRLGCEKSIMQPITLEPRCRPRLHNRVTLQQHCC